MTGGSRGIGEAIASRLAAEGADIAITYEQSRERAEKLVAAIQEQGRRALAVQADAVDAAAVTAAVDRVAAELGGLDILVNNAGVLVTAPIDQLVLDDIDYLLNVNL